MATLTNRSLSLDVFRGMTICFMIIVNSPGSGAEPFAPLLHAQWHGFTPTDLVFPSFLFAVGNAMSFSMAKLTDNPGFLRKVFRRTLLIFVLGFLMYWFPFVETGPDGNWRFSPFGNTRIMGVLQRIALCYLFASLLIRYLSTRAVLWTSALLLAGYWVLLLLFAASNDPYGMTNNAGTLLDKFVFGDKHLYHGEGIPFDPEGLLGTLPAIVNVIAGYYAGKFLKEAGRNYKTITELMLTGSLLVLLALCWNSFFPINKKIWSSSFVLLTVGLDLVILSALIYIVELRQWNPANWTKFFLVFGKNPLFIYLLSELLLISLYRIRISPQENLLERINNTVFQPALPGAFGSLAFAIVFMLICWWVGWWMDKKKVYIKV